MTSPLADEEELLRLVMEGLSQSKIAERKGVSRQAVAQRLSTPEVRAKMAERGVVVHSGRPTLSWYWVPWKLGTTRWRYHHITKMLRLLGRSVEGPAPNESDERRLRTFLGELDSMEKLPSGRGVVTYRGEDIGYRVINRQPGDRGYIRWPEGVEDTRPPSPVLRMPDDPA
jgi:Predicted transcriptional regulator